MGLQLSDTRVYEPSIRARLGNHNTPILGFYRKSYLMLERFRCGHALIAMEGAARTVPGEPSTEAAMAREAVRSTHPYIHNPNSLPSLIYAVYPPLYMQYTHPDLCSLSTRIYTTLAVYPPLYAVYRPLYTRPERYRGSRRPKAPWRVRRYALSTLICTV